MSNDPAVGEEVKVCESCGVQFGCGARLEGCWCTEVTLPEWQADAIRSKFNDCLCPACLGSFSAEQAMKMSDPNVDR